MSARTATAADLLRAARADGLAVSATPDGNLRVRGPRAAIGRWAPLLRERKAAMLELLATEPRQRPEPKPARREYTPASDEELERMLTRWHRARAAGLTPDEADRLADRLHTRDREGLRDLHACLECRHLRAQFGGGWACRMWRVTGAADAALPREFVVGLHRCAGFDGGGT